ncbi:MAG: DUF1573 domain-containing protein [Segetibacter sp.]|jgi:hypothetical protein|nr:DUF1573 domain-containing protein [Segetibacter sp.]
MKYLLVPVFTIILLIGCNSESNTNDQNNVTADVSAPTNEVNAIEDSANYTSLQWIDPIDQELGKVQEGQVVEISWKFKNTGNKPLVITSVSASCGCTVADKPEQPIAPGKEGTIKAKFDSKGRSGMEHKNVYVMANTKQLQDHQLSFRLEVEKNN